MVKIYRVIPSNVQIAYNRKYVGVCDVLFVCRESIIDLLIRSLIEAN